MSIIEGIDIYLAGVDYDARHEKLLTDSFDVECRKELEPLWSIIDYYIDRQARSRNALYADAEEMYMAIEDFCIHKNYSGDIIPPLYKYLFNARKGFLTQAKFPNCIRKQWLQRFTELQPKSLVTCPVVNEFHKFMVADRETYYGALIDLEDFGYEFDWSDEDDAE